MSQPSVASVLDYDGRLKRNVAMIEGKKAAGLKTLAALDEALVDAAFLASDALSIDDIAVYAYTHLAGDCGFDLGAFPALASGTLRVSESIGSAFPVYPTASTLTRLSTSDGPLCEHPKTQTRG